MGEEVKMSEYETNGDVDEDRVLEWEVGLPSADDITPLSQLMIPPELASAFSISPEPSRTIHDVNRASQSTLTSLRGGINDNGGAAALPSNNNNNFKSFAEARAPMVVEEAEEEEEEDRVGSGCGGGSDSKKSRRTDCSVEEAESAAVRTTDTTAEDDLLARTLKRPRLVWTPQLHKRFVDVVTHLGIKNAVPKTIMQLMNVEGLTRENVASHLQKYRLYLKRMQGLSVEGPSASDHLFASTPVPPQSFSEGGGGGDGDGLHGNGGHMVMPLPVPYVAPMMPVPVFGHMGMQLGSQGPMGYHHHSHEHYHHHHHGGGGFESNPYMLQQRDWSGNTYGSVASYPPVGGGSNRED